MKSRKLFSFCLAGILGATLFCAPFGISKSYATLDSLKTSVRRENNMKKNLSIVEGYVVSSASEFTSSRSFELSISDVDAMQKVFEDLRTTEVVEVYEVDAMNDFADVKQYTSGDSPNAVRFKLLVTDYPSFLTTLEKLELPVYSVEYTAPNEVNFIYLTGGTV